uniref:Uncharacterized protein n=1 Tax=Anopheles merus TaxID=30066 RepID=A0A182UYW5_ANOME
MYMRRINNRSPNSGRSSGGVARVTSNGCEGVKCPSEQESPLLVNHCIISYAVRHPLAALPGTFPEAIYTVDSTASRRIKSGWPWGCRRLMNKHRAILYNDWGPLYIECAYPYIRIDTDMPL